MSSRKFGTSILHTPALATTDNALGRGAQVAYRLVRPLSSRNLGYPGRLLRYAYRYMFLVTLSVLSYSPPYPNTSAVSLCMSCRGFSYLSFSFRSPSHRILVLSSFADLSPALQVVRR